MQSAAASAALRLSVQHPFIDRKNYNIKQWPGSGNLGGRALATGLGLWRDDTLVRFRSRASSSIADGEDAHLCAGRSKADILHLKVGKEPYTRERLVGR